MKVAENNAQSLPKGYKQTEVGLIPSDWEVCTLAEAVDFLDGQRRPIKSGERKYGEYPYYGASGIIDYVEDYIFDDELILLGEDGENILSRNLPLAFRVKGKIWVNNHAHVLKPRESFDIRFLTDYLESLDYSLLNSGTAQPKLNKQACLNIKVTCPTLTEQSAIANALSDADALISSLEKLITKKRNIKQGAMQKLLQPKAGWEVKMLGEIANVNMGQSPLSEYYNSEGIGLPLIQGNADVEKRKTIIRFYTSMITKRGKTGDIIMSVRAPVGEISKATFDCCLGRGVCSILFDNEYLFHYLIYFEKSWAKLSTGSTFDSVNSKQVKELGIPIPTSKEEQTRIATILSDMDTEITALETKLEKYKKVKLGMMQNLLTGKIRLV
jgi:type I restriction enzyme S subunit